MSERRMIEGFFIGSCIGVLLCGVLHCTTRMASMVANEPYPPEVLDIFRAASALAFGVGVFFAFIWREGQNMDDKVVITIDKQFSRDDEGKPQAVIGEWFRLRTYEGGEDDQTQCIEAYRRVDSLTSEEDLRKVELGVIEQGLKILSKEKKGKKHD